MHIDRAMLKDGAKSAMRESGTNPYITAAVYILIVYVLGLLQSKLTGVTVDYDTMIRALETGNYDYLLYAVQQQMPGPVPGGIGTLLSIMSTMVGIGFTIFTLLVSRRQPNTIGNLFDGFGNFFRFIWLLILIWLFTFLWSLLFVFPGLIAAYRYRQAIYLLIDNPDMRAIDCIRKSKEMMKGHKAELFVLDLSFLGWFILTLIPFVSIYVSPYTQTTYAAYYDTLLSISSDPDRSAPRGARYPETGDDGTPPWEFKN